jgi:RimJ/RimL family protein N-acetyltransferase
MNPTLTIGCSPQIIEAANAILRLPEVWEPQRIDGVERETADVATALYAKQGSLLMLVNDTEGQPQGFLLFEKHAEDLYELHTNLKERFRGKAGFAAITDAIDWMFINTGATSLITHAPDWNSRAIMAVIEWCGGSRIGHKPQAFQRDGHIYGSQICAINVSDWAVRACRTSKFAAAGESFHREIESTLGELSHGEDPMHENAVGLAVTIGKAGSWQRGVSLYNHIARLMGYQHVRIEGRSADGSFLMWMGNAILKISPQIQVVRGWKIVT